VDFTHSFASNQELSKIIRSKTISIKREKVRYIFIPFCVWKPVDAWHLYLEGDQNKLYDWLNTRLKIGQKQLLLEKIVNHFSRKHIVFLFEDILEKDQYIKGYIESLILELESSNVICEKLFIKTRVNAPNRLKFDHSLHLPAAIKKYIIDTSSSSETLILSRLDSDDMFCLSHDETLLRVAESLRKLKKNVNKPLLLDFPVGLQYVTYKKMIYSTLWPENNFASIMTNHLEIKNNPVSVPFAYSHDNIPEGVTKITISTLQAQWLQMVHGSNLANKVFPWSRYIGSMSLVSALSSL